MNYAHTYEFAENQAWDFEATVSAPTFADVVTAVEPISDDAVLEIGPDGVRSATFDPAKVVAVEANRECVQETDGELSVGLPLHKLEGNWPGYYPGGNPTYTLSVHHSGGSEDGPAAKLSHTTEGEQKLDAFEPRDRDTLDEWPDREFDYDTQVPAPKIRGALFGMATAADSLVRLTPGAETILFEADDENGEWEYEWKITVPDVGLGDPQTYSADYLRDIASGMWPTGEYTVRFGPEQPLELERDGLRYIQAPRVMD